MSTDVPAYLTSCTPGFTDTCCGTIENKDARMRGCFPFDPVTTQ